ncbi:MAG: type II toxin-antitoxin system death-on-curing family toxin [Gammaproteobacteria bacterium]|nr:type II toxin-antitoxin system death-on-curing family toxin [Gammaproteobacteria bacterium]
MSVILAIHDRQIAEHGGAEGIRDLGAVESALARPGNLTAYGQPDVADLAASLAFGLTSNHGFVDGNKRTAWVAARVLLLDNGWDLTFDPGDAVRTMEMLATGEVTESELAAWFRERLEVAETPAGR